MDRPKTEAGKAVVRLNAVKHGVLSASPVTPGLGREEDWKVHRAGIRASLAPEGHLEDTLVERIALLLWRLQRVARYETETIVLAQERAEEDLVWERTLETKGVWGANFKRLDVVVPSLDHDAAQMDVYLDRMRRHRLLPLEPELDKVMRYEAHLNRQFNQALHELEALQTRRSGGIAPLARVDVQGLPE